MKLFWLDIPRAREENCFVLARTSSQAAKFEEDGTGHDRGDVIAHEIMTLDTKTQAAVRNELLNDRQESEASSKSKKWWPAYVWDDCLKLLGVENKIVNGRDCYCLDGRVFKIERFEWSMLHKRPKVIRRVSDLLKFVKSLDGKEWVF